MIRILIAVLIKIASCDVEGYYCSNKITQKFILDDIYLNLEFISERGDSLLRLVLPYNQGLILVSNVPKLSHKWHSFACIRI